jgi:putative ABC transport system substrate-binding protein
MQRRQFILGTAAIAALALARTLHAQTSARLPPVKRIAFFHPSEKIENMTINGRRTFKEYFGELNRLGYVEGKNLAVERYSALGQRDQYADLAHTAVASQPDLIVCFSIAVALQFKSLTSTIPIVATTPDPVANGLVSNLARPNGNITGVATDAGLEVYGKRLQLLSEATRNRLSNVRYFGGAAAPKLWESTTGAALREAAQRLGIPLAATFIGDNFDRASYERVFQAFEHDQVDGVLVSDASEHFTNRALVTQLAAQHRVPAIYATRDFVEVGGLMAYGFDLGVVMRRLAGLTDEILRGAKPGEIPFYQQTKFELVLNQTAAKSLGLELPASLLAVADEVIG